MGSMSASDAAPLPRLGEVYFDVRGESRSMRLSWYADTGVAVFSIWQGGTCTGTFRLPIADLPRMVAALQRGPHGDARGPRDARGAAEQQGRTDQRGGHAREPRPEPDTGYSDPGYPGAYGEEPAPDYPDHPGQGHRAEPATEAYREGQADEYRRAGAHGRHEEESRRGYRNGSPPGGYRGEPGGYRGEPGAGYRSEPGGGYEDEPTGVYRGDPLAPGYQDEPDARYREAGYPDDPLTGRHPAQDPLTDRYPAEDPRQARYPDDPLTGRYPAEDPHPARYPEDSRTGEYPDGPHTGDDPGGAGAAGYPDDIDSQDYPASSGNAGYSPARPYVAPVPGGTGPAAEGRGQGRRRAVRGEEGDPSPDSFPYGLPPAEREARGRGR